MLKMIIEVKEGEGKAREVRIHAWGYWEFITDKINGPAYKFLIRKLHYEQSFPTSTSLSHKVSLITGREACPG